MDPNALYRLEDLPSVASITPARRYRRNPAVQNSDDPPKCDDATKCCAGNFTSGENIVTGSKVSLQIPRILEEYPDVDGSG